MTESEILEWCNNIVNVTQIVMNVANRDAKIGWRCEDVYFEPEHIIVHMIERGYKDRIKDDFIRTMSFEEVASGE